MVQMREDADEQEKKRELEAVGEMSTTLEDIFIAHNTKLCRSDTLYWTCACSKKAAAHSTFSARLHPTPFLRNPISRISRTTIIFHRARENAVACSRCRQRRPREFIGSLAPQGSCTIKNCTNQKSGSRSIYITPQNRFSLLLLLLLLLDGVVFKQKT